MVVVSDLEVGVPHSTVLAVEVLRFHSHLFQLTLSAYLQLVRQWSRSTVLLP